jgi:hypothetical protein
MVSDERAVKHRNQNLDSPLMASSVYKNGTLRRVFHTRSSPKKPLDFTHLKFESRLRTTRPRFLESSPLPKAAQTQLSGRKGRREHATRWLDYSFASAGSLDERCARQSRHEPPSKFPWTLPQPWIAHHLAGPNKYVHTQTSSN